MASCFPSAGGSGLCPPFTNSMTAFEHIMCMQVIVQRCVQCWMQVAAEASIPAAAKFYCPNPACSTLMVSDDAGPNTHAECPACHKLMCMWCRTAWHSEQTCGEAKVHSKGITYLYRLLHDTYCLLGKLGTLPSDFLLAVLSSKHSLLHWVNDVLLGPASNWQAGMKLGSIWRTA